MKCTRCAEHKNDVKKILLQPHVSALHDRLR